MNRIAMHQQAATDLERSRSAELAQWWISWLGSNGFTVGMPYAEFKLFYCHWIHAGVVLRNGGRYVQVMN